MQSFANQIGWTDVTPFEIIRRISDKTLVVRQMKSERAADWSPVIVLGGFVGHCLNQNEQRWTITTDESYDEVRIRLHKDGSWRSKDGARFKLSDEPKRFYDYNF